MKPSKMIIGKNIHGDELINKFILGNILDEMVEDIKHIKQVIGSDSLTDWTKIFKEREWEK
jgi:hypothetical protein